MLNYFQQAHAAGTDICFGCGRPDRPGVHLAWPVLREHLEQHSCVSWTSEDLAHEEDRYQRLAQSEVKPEICITCYAKGAWPPGEADRLHRRAQRFAADMASDYQRRAEQRLHWAEQRLLSGAGLVERKIVSPLVGAAQRWADIWVLNNPGSRPPYRNSNVEGQTR
jgi:hypothetical protein